MVSRAPSTIERLQTAALELFSSEGYDRVTVVQIAERAGVARRTFFRCFADKREVLFSGAEALDGALVDLVEAVPRDVPPLDAALRALSELGRLLGEHAPDAELRREIIATTRELQERERTKLAGLATTLTASLEHRQTDPMRAALLARVAVVAFQAAWDLWLDRRRETSFGGCLDDVTEELRTAMCAP